MPPITDHSMASILGLAGLPERTDDVRCTSTAPRRRRSRTVYTEEARDAMEQLFAENPYPDIAQREKLAAQIGMPEARIQVWFQNRRARYRKKPKKRGPKGDFKPSANRNPSPSDQLCYQGPPNKQTVQTLTLQQHQHWLHVPASIGLPVPFITAPYYHQVPAGMTGVTGLYISPTVHQEPSMDSHTFLSKSSPGSSGDTSRSHSPSTIEADSTSSASPTSSDVSQGDPLNNNSSCESDYTAHTQIRFPAKTKMTCPMLALQVTENRPEDVAARQDVSWGASSNSLCDDSYSQGQNCYSNFSFDLGTGDFVDGSSGMATDEVGNGNSPDSIVGNSSAVE